MVLPPAGAFHERRGNLKPGDLILPVSGYPQLCEVVRVEPDGRLRLKVFDWAPGTTVLVPAKEYQRVTARLAY